MGDAAGAGGLPELYKIYPATVERVTSFGAFCSILGFAKQGLLHVSQLAHARVEKPEDVVSIGERIFVKVISHGEDPETPKISLSIKTVNQGNGADLDPNNLTAAKDAKVKRGEERPERPRIELGAVYNVRCTRCGAYGHMSKMCRAVGKYELVEENEPDGPPETSAIDAAFIEHERKLQKQAKRALKRQLKQAKAEKERQQFSMDSYMAQGEAVVSRKSKKEKKHKKKSKKDKKSQKDQSRVLDDSSEDERPAKRERFG